MPAARSCLLLLALALAALAAAPPVPSIDEAVVAAHEATLRGAGLKFDGPALLEVFRKRTLSESRRAELATLVRQLGADEFEDREKASAALVAAGARAVPFLRPALTDRDIEVKRRAEDCVRAIEVRSETTLLLAAAELLAVRRPAGSAEVVLNYLPFADDAVVEEHLLRTLSMVGVREGKADAVVVKALKSKQPIQRAAAGWVMGRSARAEQRALVVPLLKDADAGVRWRAAESLVAGRDKRGVPALVGLLETGPLEPAGQAESLLMVLAGDDSPAVALGATGAEREKCRLAWAGWWRSAEGKLDLSKFDFDKRLLGRRLVVALNGYGGQGAVWELGPDRKQRWQLRNVGGPFDVRVLPAGRVLVAEYEARRVTERYKSGKIVWEHRLTQGPLEVQRLANGHTFIATNWELREVTRAGRVVFTHPDRSGNIFSGQRLPNGHTLYGLYTGWLIELDRAGKEVKKIPIPRPGVLILRTKRDRS
jgi:hypothetical protein